MANKGQFLGSFYATLGEKLILSLIVVFPLLLIWQGLDFTDTGYVLTNYQQIFNDPESISASFRIWFTNVLGGVWERFFGSFGVVGFRLAGVLISYASLYFSYLTLRPFIARKYLLPGLFLALVCINRFGYLLNYNILTAFFNVLGAYLLTRGLRERSNLLIACSGFILAVNLFVRLPNILAVTLGASILFYGLLTRTPFLALLKQLTMFLTGYLSAILLIFIFMYFAGQLDSYMKAFTETFLMLKDPAGHHRWDYVVTNYLDHHKNILVKTGMLLAGFYALSVILAVTSRWGSSLLQSGIILAAAAFMLSSHLEYLQNWVHMVTIITGILYYILLCAVVGVIKPEEPGARSGDDINGFRLAAWAALTLLVVTPLGSNIPIWNVVYGMYLPIPLVVGLVLGSRRDGFRAVRALSANFFGRWAGQREKNLMTAISLGVFLVLTLSSIYHYTYRDSESRMDMRYSVNHPLLKGVLTTGERALVVQDLVDVLPQYVQNGDYLLTYEQTSMVHYLTKTRPYLYSAWPMLYSPAQFKQALARARQERPYLPVIVRAKGNTEVNYWPRQGKKLRSYYHDEARKVMEAFIREENYKLVWQSSFFEILLPEKRIASTAVNE